MRRNEILLDTHIILWAILRDSRLTDKINRYLLNPNLLQHSLNVGSSN